MDNLIVGWGGGGGGHTNTVQSICAQTFTVRASVHKRRAETERKNARLFLLLRHAYLKFEIDAIVLQTFTVLYSNVNNKKKPQITTLKLHWSYSFIIVYNLQTGTASPWKGRIQITLSNTLFLCHKAQMLLLLHWNLNVRPEECQENKFNTDLLRAADCIDYLQ